VPAPAEQCHDSGAGSPEAGGLADDPAAALQAGNVGLPGRRRIETTELERIGVIETGSLDRDKDLARPGNRVREVTDRGQRRRLA
jgi:hypothetical protein